MLYVRWSLFLVGLIVFSLGISVTIKVQHLGVHPWDVLSIALYDKLGFSIGTWNITIGVLLIGVSFVLDKSYIKLGTFLNAFVVGTFVDLFLWLDFLPNSTSTWTDIPFILGGIVTMGIGGGMYNAARVGAGPRDGFMLSIADKLNAPIGRVRIVTETSILVIGFLLGGPVFLFTFLFTFIQSPLFQYSFLSFSRVIDRVEYKVMHMKKQRVG